MVRERVQRAEQRRPWRGDLEHCTVGIGHRSHIPAHLKVGGSTRDGERVAEGARPIVERGRLRARRVVRTQAENGELAEDKGVGISDGSDTVKAAATCESRGGHRHVAYEVLEWDGHLCPEERRHRRAEMVHGGNDQCGVVHVADAAQVVMHRHSARRRHDRLDGRGERLGVRAVGRSEREGHRVAGDNTSRAARLDGNEYGPIHVRDERQPGRRKDLLREKPKRWLRRGEHHWSDAQRERRRRVTGQAGHVSGNRNRCDGVLTE